MSYQDIRNAREGLVNMAAGDRLISIESKILALVAFVVMLAYFKMGIVSSLIVGALVGFVFPRLVGLIRIFAWVATIAFSIIWAGIGYFIVGAIGGDSPVIGLMGAVVIFIVSFFLHKIFAGLGYSSITKHSLDAWDNTEDNTSQTNQILNNMNTQSVKYCVNCGTELKANAGFCTKCGSSQ